ncbi:MAG: hypothetical protein CVV17_05475 [Gammaproteobacteria bacterium HGW-Gammaproteobacteria-7]|nr:MAG: hypothetical protein CVV17_05475 [Gammaproteobacteria bacterium HGW-Gammaproteobacteria-7]
MIHANKSNAGQCHGGLQIDVFDLRMPVHAREKLPWYDAQGDSCRWRSDHGSNSLAAQLSFDDVSNELAQPDGACLTGGASGAIGLGAVAAVIAAELLLWPASTTE